MQTLYFFLILFLLLTLVAGLWRIRRGPTAADRMLAAQLFGTTATAVLLLLAEVSGEPALRDVALVLALLAAITVTAFTHRSRMVTSADRAALAEAADGTGEVDAEAEATSAKATAGNAVKGKRNAGETAAGENAGETAAREAEVDTESSAGDQHAG